MFCYFPYFRSFAHRRQIQSLCDRNACLEKKCRTRLTVEWRNITNGMRQKSMWKVKHEEKIKTEIIIERNKHKQYNNIHIIHIMLWLMTDWVFFVKWETMSRSAKWERIQNHCIFEIHKIKILNTPVFIYIAGGTFQTSFPFCLPLCYSFVGCDLCTNLGKLDFMNIIFVLRINWRHHNVGA